jgi:folate-binding protein YgfZ
MPAVSLRDAALAPRDYGDVRAEWRALTQGAGAILLPDFGVLRVEGRDRVSWLHNLITADVEALQEGSGAYSLLLEAKAHVVADFVLLKQSDSFLLYTSRAAHEKLFPNLRRAIFREKVILTDISAQFGILSLQGPNSRAVAEKTFNANLSIPSAALRGRYAVSQSQISYLYLPFTTFQLLFVSNSRAAADGFDLLAPRDGIPALWDALIASGAHAVGFDALNVARVEAGIPWFGDDFDDTILAPEARLDAFIAQDKGCYPGQEVIARIRNLGHVNRLLTQLLLTNGESPDRGDLIFSDDKEIGRITSPVWSFAHNAPLALGYTRREYAADGTRVQIAHGDARLDAIVNAIA